jgi:nucleoside-diphosphate-sugar epimerase
MPIPPHLTVLGGGGYVGSNYVMRNQSHLINNNVRDDYEAHSEDILYFISTVHNYNIFTDPTLDINTNLYLLVKVLTNWKIKCQLLGKSGVFNFISSWFVYGENGNTLNVSEDAPCNPKGFYSITKRTAEQLLITYCETFGLNYRILRLANVIGKSSCGICDQKVSSQKNVLQYLINKLKNNEDIEAYHDGNFYRDYIHVDDCVDAIDIIINNGNVNEIYNVGNSRTWNFIDILLHAKNVLGSTSKISFADKSTSLHQIKSFYMNNTKLLTLGYSPKYTDMKLFDSLL